MDGFMSYDHNDSDFFELQSPLTGSVKLSHLNNKSSVLCPKNQNITVQYLALQQLDAHQKMIARAKGIVDTYAPQSMQSYISTVDKQKKKLWKKSGGHCQSALSNGEHSSDSSSSSRPQSSNQVDNFSTKSARTKKATVGEIPLTSNTDDKIIWYLEAVKQGELMTPPFVCVKEPVKTSPVPKSKRSLNRDILDTHVNCFVRAEKTFSPRVVADTKTKSKIREMRCYQPPIRKTKEKNSSESSDTFESYQDESNEEKDFDHVSEEIEINSESHESVHNRLVKHQVDQDRMQHERSNTRKSSSSGNEDKYLEFLSKVTEHILKRGIYSDKAIQQAFEFHMQFYEENSDKVKLQSLANQMMESMKISVFDSGEVDHPLFTGTSTPPTKDISSLLGNVRNESTEDEMNDQQSDSGVSIERNSIIP